jgi:NDP-sugar pyrophosphorylase family protein
MKEKVAITLDDGLLSSLDGLVSNGVGKNRSQIIEAFLREHMSEKNRIHAIILAHDIKWDWGVYPFDLPKYLIDIEDKPVLFHQIRSMSQAGIRRVTVVIGNELTELYKEVLAPFFPHMEIEYVEVDTLAKTGIALRAGVANVTDAEYLLVTNGDTYIPDLDILDLLEYHKANKSDWTFVLKYIRTNIEKFGNVTIHGNHVEEFIEKPSTPDMYRYLTNCGWYMVTRDFYDSLTYHGEHIEVDMFPELPEKGNILAYTYSKLWYHIQSLAEYEMANGY